MTIKAVKLVETVDCFYNFDFFYILPTNKWHFQIERFLAGHLKVRKSRKFYVLKIAPAFGFGRIKDAIICFWDLLTFISSEKNSNYTAEKGLFKVKTGIKSISFLVLFISHNQFESNWIIITNPF